MSRIVVTGTLAADVADAATFTVNYPNALPPEFASPTDEGDFFGAQGHQIMIGQNPALLSPRSFAIAHGTAAMTVTNNSGSSWRAGDKFTLSLEAPGAPVFAPPNDGGPGVRMARMSKGSVYMVNLGAPDALVTNGVMAAQNRTNAGALLLNGSLAVGGVVTLDRPRNIIADSGGLIPL